MDRYTKRGSRGKVYATAPAQVCWGNRPISERAFCTGCHESKDNRDIDRSKCGPLAIIDRLAAYEDTGLSPEEITDLQRAWDMYGGEEGITALLATPPNDPLTVEELWRATGKPVWIERSGYQGRWALIVWSNRACLHTYGGGILEFGEYRKEWTAYRRKPKESAP